MNVIFLEPGFPANQREFVRALASIGAHRHRRRRPALRLARRRAARAGSAATSRSRSVTDEGALEWAVRQVQGRMWVDRLEAVIEAHVMPAAHVRERCRHPRHLGAHRLSLPRQGGDEGGAAPRRRADAPPRPGSPASPRPRAFVEARGLSGDPEAARRRRRLRHLPRRRRRRARRTPRGRAGSPTARRWRSRSSSRATRASTTR